MTGLLHCCRRLQQHTGPGAAGARHEVPRLGGHTVFLRIRGAPGDAGQLPPGYTPLLVCLYETRECERRSVMLIPVSISQSLELISSPHGLRVGCFC